MNIFGLDLDRVKDPNYGRKAIKQAKRNNEDVNQARRRILRNKALAAPLTYLRRRIGALRLAKPDVEARVNQATGWAEVQPIDVSLVNKIVDTCNRIQQTRKEESEFKEWLEGRISDGKKSHIVNVLQQQNLLDYPEIMEFVLSDQILSLVTDYFDCIPKLQSVQLWWTMINDSNCSSQLFHVDEIDERQLKFFVHIWDVDDECGPFHLVSSAASERVRRKLGHVSGRLSDDEVLANCDPSDLIKVTADAGFCACVDTCRCLHFGSRASNKERLVLMFHFTPFAEIHEANFPLRDRKSVV